MAVGGECGGPASATQPPPGCGQPALEPRLVLARARGTQDRWVGGEGSSGCEGPSCLLPPDRPYRLDSQRPEGLGRPLLPAGAAL